MMKKESLSHKLYENIEELKIDVDEFMDFFNNYRLLRKLDNLPPNAFEKRYFGREPEETIDDCIPY